MNRQKTAFILLIVMQLYGCGTSEIVDEEVAPVVDAPIEDSTGEVANENPEIEQPLETLSEKLERLANESPINCLESQGGVNYSAIADADCNLLSQYGLFKDKTKPQYAANGNGLFYDLSVELFSDYASKYRFLFIPDGAQLGFSYTDVFEFPLGTVLVKTFAMPFDTAIRGEEHERLLETRLLIKRNDGWAALPFVWTENGEDAVLTKYGAHINIEMINAQENHQFIYEVPSKTTCKTCHQKEISENEVKFSPIGFKARFLDWALEGEKIGQLQKLHNDGLLSGDTIDLEKVESVPATEDTTDDLTARAKGYLDLNCGHCHQEGGFGGLSGLRLTYWQSQTTIAHGVCKKPPGYDGGLNHLAYDIVPGSSTESILHYRMSVTTPKDIMPPIGRHIVHIEGLELISQWIDNMPPVDCGQ